MMHFAKHETEPLAWVRESVTAGPGKHAFMPGVARDIARSHVIAGAYKKPPPTPIDDAKQVGECFMPISLQQLLQQGFAMEAWGGAQGFPVYDKSKKQRPDDKRKACEKKAAQMSE